MTTTDRIMADPVPEFNDPNFWRPGGLSSCMVCGGLADTVLLDLGFCHPTCDPYPDEVGAVRILP